MTLADLRPLCLQAMQGVRHEHPDATIGILSVLTSKEREDAAAVYRSLIGERLLAPTVGRFAGRG